jgi:hypothetical protein
LLQVDTIAYLRLAQYGSATDFRPLLYPILLKPVLALGELSLVPLLQHALGLAIALVLYVLLRRLGVGPNVSALGVAPVLLDGYQLIIEQYVLTEALFDALVVSSVTLILWRPRPSLGAVALTGVLVAAAGLTRFVGLALITPLMLFFIIQRFGWPRLVTLAVGFTAPLVVYSAWTGAGLGGGATERNGFFLYGRVATFASCEHVEVPPSQRTLCIEKPPREGLEPTGFRPLDPPKRITRSPRANQILLSFSKRIILARPLQYAAAVGSDFMRFFAARSPESQEPNVARWRFPRSLPDASPHPIVRRLGGSAPARLGFERFRITAGPAAALRSYQTVVYTYGPLLGVLLLLGAVGSLVLGPPWKQRRAGACLLLTLLAAAMLLGPVLTTVYHFRYVLPALPLLGPAGALGGSLIAERLSHR